MLKRLGICAFCFKPIKTTEKKIELESDEVVHEECYLSRRYDYYKKGMEDIDKFEKFVEDFLTKFNETQKLTNELKESLTEKSKFYDLWGGCQRSKMDIDLVWFFALHYFARKSSFRRFVTWLKSSHIVYVQLPSISGEWDDRWSDLLSTLSDYFYFYLMIPTFWIRKKDEKIKLKKEKKYLKKIDYLLDKLNILTNRVVKKSREDIGKYSQALDLEFREWRHEYSEPLRKYNLI